MWEYALTLPADKRNAVPSPSGQARFYELGYSRRRIRYKNPHHNECVEFQSIPYNAYIFTSPRHRNIIWLATLFESSCGWIITHQCKRSEITNFLLHGLLVQSLNFKAWLIVEKMQGGNRCKAKPTFAFFYSQRYLVLFLNNINLGGLDARSQIAYRGCRLLFSIAMI